MIIPYSRTQPSNEAIRPDGDMGVQITFSIDGEARLLWLSASKTDAVVNNKRVAAEIFRTPENISLNIAFGKMLEGLLREVELEIPDSLRSSRVDQLEFVRYPQSSYAYALKVSLDYGDSSIAVWVQLTKKNGKWGFALTLRLGDINDPVEVTVEIDNGSLSGYLKQDTNPKSINFSSLAKTLSPELGDLLDTVEIAPTMLALATHKSSGNYFFALELEGDLSLSRLPFVGERLPKGAEVGIRNMSLAWSSAGLASDEQARTQIREMLPSVDLIKVPANSNSWVDPLSSGGIFSAKLIVAPDTETHIVLPLQSPVAKATVPGKSVTVTPDPQTLPAAKGPVKWVKVGKNAGPLLLKQIGFKYENKKIWFLFDASLSAGPVTLIVDGLGAGLDPSGLLNGHFEPSFTLRGLGIAIKGPAEIGGAFLRDRIEDERGAYDEFSGVIIVKTKVLTVSGMGSYADPPWGDPSLFAYAFLDKPIGGPAFFFVTGLALGIAINRNLDLPPIEQISKFPLVRLALGESLTPPSAGPSPVHQKRGDSDLDRLLEVQRAMRPYTTPASGKFVVAVGVRFTTFNIINSFALLAVSLNKPVRVDLLVSARLQVPPLPPGPNVIKPPVVLAQIGIDLRGAFLPEDGTLLVEGRITEGSWFLDSSCRLSGGAAFASWGSGKHAGDFVTTVGGYHPNFHPPAHYPKVPRLAFNFTSGPVQIKGDAYFAMTPSALMAGGSLSATYANGDVKAWFDCGADFLVAWEPFSYEASMHIEVGASCRTPFGILTMSIGASLSMWGPDLAGIATLDLDVATVDVEFGPSKKLPAPLDAKTFRERFLPDKKDELISVSVGSGLIRTGTHKGFPLFVVNPAEFSMMIESVIPEPNDDNIGIGSMGKMSLGANKKSVITWEIKKDNDSEKSNFKAVPIEKPVPSALWGPANSEGQVLAPGLAAENTVINAATGHTISPKDQTDDEKVKAEFSKKYDTSAFRFNSDKWPGLPGMENLVWPVDFPVFIQSQETVKKILGKHSNPAVQLLSSLTGESRDFDSELSLSADPDWLDELQTLPSVRSLESAL